MYKVLIIIYCFLNAQLNYVTNNCGIRNANYREVVFRILEKYHVVFIECYTFILTFSISWATS